MAVISPLKSTLVDGCRGELLQESCDAWRLPNRLLLVSPRPELHRVCGCAAEIIVPSQNHLARSRPGKLQSARALSFPEASMKSRSCFEGSLPFRAVISDQRHQLSLLAALVLSNATDPALSTEVLLAQLRAIGIANDGQRGPFVFGFTLHECAKKPDNEQTNGNRGAHTGWRSL